MRIALLGATGRTGRLVLEQARLLGHDVVALARTPHDLDVDGATVITGDLRDADAVGRLVRGADAVISAVGARGRDADLHTVLARNTIDAMTAAAVNRFVGISVGGVDIPGDRKTRRDRMIGVIARTLAGAAAADRVREYEAWRDSDRAWTLIRVPRLVDGPASGTPVVDAHKPPRGITLRRTALATLLVDCATTGRAALEAPFAADS